jgi:hypothetical protein
MKRLGVARNLESGKGVKKLRKTKMNLSQDSGQFSRDPNQAPSDYRPRALPSHQLDRCTDINPGH